MDFARGAKFRAFTLSQIHEDMGGRKSGYQGARIGATKEELEERDIVSYLAGCIRAEEKVTYKGRVILADGREYICPSQRWRFVENLIKDEFIYDFMSLMGQSKQLRTWNSSRN